jgi:hypothetical protein
LETVSQGVEQQRHGLMAELMAAGA